MEMKYYVEGVPGFRFGERFAVGYTIPELKRLIRHSYPDKNARVWVEQGYGFATTIIEEWRKDWDRKYFRRVR